MTIAIQRDLTARELQVLQLIADGGTDVTIARALFLQPTTVKSHVYRIGLVLGTTTRTQSVAIAIRHGLIT
jgi:DNA-binding NarL/FixJ family response regulator